MIFALITGLGGMVTLDIQADLLNFLAQESLAHAALVFATLAAAFTFASGFRRSAKEGAGASSWGNNEMIVYGAILFSLFLVAIYALFRFSFYAALADYALNHPSPPANQTLSEYWRNVTFIVQGTQKWTVPFTGLYNFGLFGLVISLFIAYLFTFVVTLLGSGRIGQIQFGTLVDTTLLVIACTGFLTLAAILIPSQYTVGYGVWVVIPFFFTVLLLTQHARHRNAVRHESPKQKPNKSKSIEYLGSTSWKILDVAFFVIAMLPPMLWHFDKFLVLRGIYGYSPLTPILIVSSFYVVLGFLPDINFIRSLARTANKEQTN